MTIMEPVCQCTIHRIVPGAALYKCMRCKGVYSEPERYRRLREAIRKVEALDPDEEYFNREWAL